MQIAEDQNAETRAGNAPEGGESRTRKSKLKEDQANYRAALRLKKLVYYPQGGDALVRSAGFAGVMLVFGCIVYCIRSLVTSVNMGDMGDMGDMRDIGGAYVDFRFDRAATSLISLLLCSCFTSIMMDTDICLTVYILLYSNAFAPIAEVFFAMAKIAEDRHVRYHLRYTIGHEYRAIMVCTSDRSADSVRFLAKVLYLLCVILQYKQSLASFKEIRVGKGKRIGGLKKLALFLLLLVFGLYVRYGLFRPWEPRSIMEIAGKFGYDLAYISPK